MDVVKMSENILDAEDKRVNNKMAFVKVIFCQIVMFVLFMVLSFYGHYLPRNIIDGVRTSGLLIMIITILIAIYTSTILNEIEPRIKDIKILILIGLSVLIIELVNLTIVSLSIIGEMPAHDLKGAFCSSLFISIIAALVANINIHSKRGKKLKTPILLLISFWAITSLLIMLTN